MNEEIELTERWAVIGLPENAVEAELKIKVYLDGEIVECSKVLDISAIRAAFQEAEENYDDPNATYCLTEKGIRYAESLRKD